MSEYNIPYPWVETLSKSKNAYYYFNIKTKFTCWKVENQNGWGWFIKKDNNKYYLNISNGKSYTEKEYLDELEVEKVASHYNKREDTKAIEREQSDIFHLRNLNNWIKSCAIIQYFPLHGMKVIDFACGKGGDLKKWTEQHIHDYVGIDIAASSVTEAMNRYKKMKLPFTARFMSADLGKVDLNPIFNNELFDCVSCQFAFHYFFQSESRLDTALHSISGLLAEGGIFICTLSDGNSVSRLLRGYGKTEENKRVWKNSICKIEMNLDQYSRLYNNKNDPYGISYDFTLSGVVEECTEYITFPAVMEQKAKENDLEVLYYKNCQIFADECIRDDRYRSLCRTMYVFNNQGKITDDEWESCQVYNVMILKKKGIFKGYNNDIRGKPSNEIKETDIQHY
ncbi:hypothetical protein WA158_006767 [Blastocystis sp. Blastoise]